MAADPDLTHMVQANDKLLKALITLLALKDEHILDEMREVFAAALQTRSPVGRADPPTWAHIRKELSLISALVEAMEHHEDSDLAPVNEMN